MMSAVWREVPVGMVMLKLLGAVLLVGSMGGVSYCQYKRTREQLLFFQAWRAFLSRMRHSVADFATPLEEIMRWAIQDRARLARLSGSDKESGEIKQGARAQFSHLCRMAAQHPDAGSAAEALAALPQAFFQADSVVQTLAALDATDSALREMEQKTQTDLRQRCRAVSAMYLCGAGMVVLLLW